MYIIKKTGNDINCINDKAWDFANVANIDKINWPEFSHAPKTTAKLLYNDYGIYVQLETDENPLLARYCKQNDMVCCDSCMEFFFRPMEGDLRYFNLEINPNGQMYIGFGHSMKDLIRLALQDEQGMLQKKWNYTEDGWEVFYTFPVSVIQVFFPGYELKSGMKIYANSYKCGDECVIPHFISWNKIELEDPSFHQPEHFGLMILE